MTADPSVSFPRLQARTARFTLGRPRSFAVSPDGARVVFLRSRGGDDRATCLWVYDVAAATERLVADPVALLSGEQGTETDAERARRERAREQAAGIVGYSLDRDAQLAAFVLAGRLFVADLEVAADAVRPIATGGPVFDPRLDPTGRWIGYASDGALRVAAVDAGTARGSGDATVPDPDRLLITEPDVRWGVAEFVAAEEMGRQRGFWWAPDGAGLLAARVDESPVQTWYIGDPANPSREPAVVRYPSAGTANAEVSLAYLGLDGSRQDVEWDRVAFPYLVSVRWPRGFAPLVTVSSRDQRIMRVLEIDLATGTGSGSATGSATGTGHLSTQVLREDTDLHWVDIVPGVPDRLSDGRLVWVAATGDTHRLVIGSETVTPIGLQVNAVVAVSGTDVLLSASTESTEQHLWYVASVEQRAGVETSCERLTTEPGVHSGAGAGDVLVTVSATLTSDGVKAVVSRGGKEIGEIASLATPPPFSPNVSLSRQGPRELRTAWCCRNTTAANRCRC